MWPPCHPTLAGSHPVGHLTIQPATGISLLLLLLLAETFPVAIFILCCRDLSFTLCTEEQRPPVLLFM